MLKIERVLVASDFGSKSDVVFAHAVRIAVQVGALLQVLHVELSTDQVSWSDLPTAEALLKHWGMLPANATARDVEILGLRIEPVAVFDEAPAAGLAKAAQALNPDLMVVGTHGRQGLDRLLRGSVSEDLMRAAMVPTLFVPHSAKPLVQLGDGQICLSRVLVPVAEEDAQLAMDTAAYFADALTTEPVEYAVVHVGSHPPTVTAPGESKMETRVKTGIIADEIAKAAQDCDLIVMRTSGHDSLADVFMGSRTERVIRQAPCPVLAVPAP